MSIELRLPNVTAARTDEKVAQLQSYLHQLVQELNWALNHLDLTDSATQTTKTESNSASTSYTESVISNANIAKREVDSLLTFLKMEDDVIKISKSVMIPEEVDGNITTFASDCEDGVTTFLVTSSTTGMPLGCTNCIGQIFKNDDLITISLTLQNGSIANNIYNNTWSGWKYIEPV